MKVTWEVLKIGEQLKHEGRVIKRRKRTSFPNVRIMILDSILKKKRCLAENGAFEKILASNGKVFLFAVNKSID